MSKEPEVCEHKNEPFVVEVPYFDDEGVMLGTSVRMTCPDCKERVY